MYIPPLSKKYILKKRNGGWRIINLRRSSLLLSIYIIYTSVWVLLGCVSLRDRKGSGVFRSPSFSLQLTSEWFAMRVVELLCSLFPCSTGQSSLESKFPGLEFIQKWLVEEPPSPSTDFPPNSHPVGLASTGHFWTSDAP